MKLYHGSDKVIQKPLFNYGKPYNDYGLGFYMTKDKQIAKLWASKHKGNGYINEYELDIKGLSVLDLSEPSEDSVLKWITILVNHRFRESELNKYNSTIEELKKRYYVDLEQYDIIIGYRADDSYFNYSRDFLANELSYETLTKAMFIGNLGKQYVLKSQKAFNHINLISFESIEHSKDYSDFLSRGLNEYHSIKNSDSINNTYIRDILRKKI